MLTLEQAMRSGLVTPIPDGYCASCGTEPAAEGYLMCHSCREKAGLTYQPRLFVENNRAWAEPRTCDCGYSTNWPPAMASHVKRCGKGAVAGDGTEAWHGTVSGYTGHGCRCPRCLEAVRDYSHGYRAKNPRRK